MNNLFERINQIKSNMTDMSLSGAFCSDMVHYNSLFRLAYQAITIMGNPLLSV